VGILTENPILSTFTRAIIP